MCKKAGAKSIMQKDRSLLDGFPMELRTEQGSLCSSMGVGMKASSKQEISKGMESISGATAGGMRASGLTTK